jgi:hypothetical protein
MRGETDGFEAHLYLVDGAAAIHLREFFSSSMPANKECFSLLLLCANLIQHRGISFAFFFLFARVLQPVTHSLKKELLIIAVKSQNWEKKKI